MGRKLLDLESLMPGKHASNVEIQPSGDGKYVAIGVSQAHDGYSIRVLDVATAALLPDSIVRSFDGDASWSDSNTTFYYRQFQAVPSGASRDAIFTNMRAYLHKLGDDPSLDKPVFGPDINPELHLPVVGAVNAFPLPGTSLLLGVQSRISEGVGFLLGKRHPQFGRPMEEGDRSYRRGTVRILFSRHRVLFHYAAERSQRTPDGTRRSPRRHHKCARNLPRLRPAAYRSQPRRCGIALRMHSTSTAIVKTSQL